MTAPAISLTPIDEHDHVSGGGRLVAFDGRELPLESASLEVTAGGGVARATLIQKFVNRHDAPLTVKYTLPLPADGAVSGFSFTVGERRVVGEIDRREAARERFEEAIAAGHSAAILEQERSSVFSQEVGNIGAGESVICETSIDQPLAWLDEGMWEWRFPTVVGPRYLGAEGRVADAERVTVDVADGALAVRMSLALEIGDELAGAIESASHRIAAGDSRVSFAAESRPEPIREADQGRSESGPEVRETGARLDRDVVIRWPVARREVGLALGCARPDGHDRAYGLLTVTPPLPAARMEAVSRDLILLIDTSGSMSGRPLEQAKRVVCALIDALGPEDRLEMVAFSSRPRRWKARAAHTDATTRRAAIAWVKKLSAGGGTEMRSGMIEAMKTLRRGAQRQVLLVTDGYVGFESEIIELACNELPDGCRLHTLGVGSAVNRSLLGPVARAGGGACAIAALDEDVERASSRLLARMNAPLVTDLAITGDAVLGSAPHRLPDLFAGAPALINLKLDPRGGSIRVRGKTASGAFDERLEAPAMAPGDGDPAIGALYGRERVEDLEMLRAGGRDDLDPAIEKVGLAFQISEDVTVDGEAIREVMPHEVPHGTAIEAFGLRPAMAMPMGAPAMRTVMGSISAAAPMHMPSIESLALAPKSRPSPLRWLVLVALALGLIALAYLLWSWLS
jgi:Ca-activated chloride channel family protein